MFTKTWKVYEEGEKTMVCKAPSATYDFSEDGEIRIIKVMGEDTTKTDEYTLIQITRDTEDDCDAEFNGQLSDGIFEGHEVRFFEAV